MGSSGGPFLLVEPDVLLCADPDPTALQRATRRRHTCVVRVIDRTVEPYGERVECGSDGELISLKRFYHTRSAAMTRVYVTTDIAVARGWSQAPADRSAADVLRAAAGRVRIGRATWAGSVHDARNPRDCRAFLEALVQDHHAAGGIFPGTVEIKSGIWTEASACVDPAARLLGPLWIGKGVRVAADEVLIGPSVEPDLELPQPGPAPARPGRMKRQGRIPRARWRPAEVWKRIFDVGFALTALAWTAPVMPFIMLAILIEDGRPFFFPHLRQKRGGGTFTCYKFRTMCHDAEALKARLAAENVCDGPQFHIRHDPRMTRVGRVLRRFHLDELPQFWNVLRGEMSVVGPRPSPDQENQFCPSWREARLSVRPGITGLWQVCRTRAPHADFQEWIRYDLEYVRHRSFRLDLWIIVQTIVQTLTGTAGRPDPPL